MHDLSIAPRWIREFANQNGIKAGKWENILELPYIYDDNIPDWAPVAEIISPDGNKSVIVKYDLKKVG